MDRPFCCILKGTKRAVSPSLIAYTKTAPAATVAVIISICIFLCHGGLEEP